MIVGLGTVGAGGRNDDEATCTKNILWGTEQDVHGLSYVWSILSSISSGTVEAFKDGKLG